MIRPTRAEVKTDVQPIPYTANNHPRRVRHHRADLEELALGSKTAYLHLSAKANPENGLGLYWAHDCLHGIRQKKDCSKSSKTRSPEVIRGFFIVAPLV